MKIQVVNGQPYGSPMDFGSRVVDPTVWKDYILVDHDPEDLSQIIEERYDSDDDVVRQVLIVNPDYNAIQTEQARISRDNALLSCDWTQLPDSPLTDVKKSEWATYRQALRNVPEQSSFPSSITWPTKPE